MASIVTKVLRAGDGVRFPPKGSSCTMHYTGWLASSQKSNPFDSSVSRGKPFVFTLGVGQVIAGWDMAVSKMSVGEIIQVEIPYQLGYGDSGYPPIIPPRSTLCFEIELLSFK